MDQRVENEGVRPPILYTYAQKGIRGNAQETKGKRMSIELKPLVWWGHLRGFCRVLGFSVGEKNLAEAEG